MITDALTIQHKQYSNDLKFKYITLYSTICDKAGLKNLYCNYSVFFNFLFLYLFLLTLTINFILLIYFYNLLDINSVFLLFHVLYNVILLFFKFCYKSNVYATF